MAGIRLQTVQIPVIYSISFGFFAILVQVVSLTHMNHSPVLVTLAPRIRADTVSSLPLLCLQIVRYVLGASLNHITLSDAVCRVSLQPLSNVVEWLREYKVGRESHG